MKEAPTEWSKVGMIKEEQADADVVPLHVQHGSFPATRMVADNDKGEASRIPLTLGPDIELKLAAIQGFEFADKKHVMTLRLLPRTNNCVAKQ